MWLDHTLFAINGLQTLVSRVVQAIHQELGPHKPFMPYWTAVFVVVIVGESCRSWSIQLSFQLVKDGIRLCLHHFLQKFQNQNQFHLALCSPLHMKLPLNEEAWRWRTFPEDISFEEIFAWRAFCVDPCWIQLWILSVAMLDLPHILIPGVIHKNPPCSHSHLQAWMMKAYVLISSNLYVPSFPSYSGYASIVECMGGVQKKTMEASIFGQDDTHKTLPGY